MLIYRENYKINYFFVSIFTFFIALIFKGLIAYELVDLLMLKSTKLSTLLVILVIYLYTIRHLVINKLHTLIAKTLSLISFNVGVIKIKRVLSVYVNYTFSFVEKKFISNCVIRI